jgi:hypothetical protein
LSDAPKKDDASKVSDASQPPVLYDLTLLEEMNDAEYLKDILHCILTHTPGHLDRLISLPFSTTASLSRDEPPILFRNKQGPGPADYSNIQGL